MNHGEQIDAWRSNLRWEARHYFDILMRENPEGNPHAHISLAMDLVAQTWEWAEKFMPPAGRP